MKTRKPIATVDPTAAFPDAKHRPDDTALASALGGSFAPFGQVVERLHALHPEVTGAWKYHPKVGWYQVQVQRKRRLVYLVPKHEAFRLSLLLGRQAIAALKAGPFAARVTKLLKNAKRYPEGTAFNFDDNQVDPDLVTALIEAKIAH